MRDGSGCMEGSKLISESRSIAGAKRFIEVAGPTFLENWPPGLRDLSIRQTDIALSPEEHVGLLAVLNDAAKHVRIDIGRGTLELNHDVLSSCLRNIENRICEALSAYSDGAYIRLGSRSPKDSPLGLREGFRVTSAAYGLAVILSSIGRVRFDLALAYRASYSPHLFIRAWQNIPAWAEFRCFMVDRELVGVSQYNYLDGKAHPEIVDHPQKIRATITEFFPIFRNACHLDNVVFDVVITIVGNAPVLLEINPAASSGLSDRCLFQREDLDGTLRYVGDGNDYSWITRIQERKARW